MTLQVTLEVQEVQFVLNAIAKQPFEQVADLWFKIKSQAEAQIKAQQAGTTEQEPAGLTDPEQA